jgi:Fur family ferric uptake transcriptional regulator
MQTRRHDQRAAQLIEEIGERPTAARNRVLAALLAAHAARTHHEIEAALGEGKVDRVTLYRVLDWLVSRGLAHRVTSEDRVWRFLASENGTDDHRHAHFQCTRCDKVVCLEDVPVQANLAMPKGYRMQEAELTVKGVCDRCA